MDDVSDGLWFMKKKDHTIICQLNAQFVEKHIELGDPFIKTILKKGRVLYG